MVWPGPEHGWMRFIIKNVAKRTYNQFAPYFAYCTVQAHLHTFIIAYLYTCILPFWSSSIFSSSILVVFHFGRLPFWSSSILVVFNFGCLPFWSSSILVVPM